MGVLYIKDPAGNISIPVVLFASDDLDNDGIPDGTEEETCTSESDIDSDDDGLSDGAED